MHESLRSYIHTLYRVTADGVKLGFVGPQPASDAQGDEERVSWWWIADLAPGVQEWGDGCPDHDSALRCVLAAHKRRKEGGVDSALAFASPEDAASNAQGDGH